MKKLAAALGDLAIFWVIVILAYGVVGFLRGRHLAQLWWEKLRPRRDAEL